MQHLLSALKKLLEFFPRSVTLPSVHKSFYCLTKLEQCPTSNWLFFFETFSCVRNFNWKKKRSGSRTWSDKEVFCGKLLLFLSIKHLDEKESTMRLLPKWYIRRQLALFSFFSPPAYQTLKTFSSVSNTTQKEGKRANNEKWREGKTFTFLLRDACDQTISQPALQHNSNRREIAWII